MRKVLGLTLAILLIGSVGLAIAGGEHKGKIVTFDSGDRLVVFEDGKKVWLSEGVSVEGLKEGAMIKVTYEERDGKPVVTTIEITQERHRGGGRAAPSFHSPSSSVCRSRMRYSVRRSMPSASAARSLLPPRSSSTLRTYQRLTSSSVIAG